MIMKNVYKIPINEDNFYLMFLSTINGVLKFSEKEILILNEFIHYENLYVQEPEIIFSTYTRKKIQTKLDISGSNLNNYIKSLKQKGAIKVINGIERVDEKIIPVIPTGENSFDITFSFVK